MKTKLLMERLDAIERQALETLKEVRAMREELGIVKVEAFPPRNYVRIAKWLQTDAGKAALPDYHTMTWEQRAERLSNIVHWDVDSHHLMVATNRL
jgi:hypothetical protein